jgi:Uma2 family endonuclease
LHSSPDDENVVVMTVRDYFSSEEDNRRRELIWGVVREPPSPFFAHQVVVTRIGVLLSLHVQQHELGVVIAAPLDVVLDEARALIVQPDVLFVSNDRMPIIRDRVWGAPDLVVEVVSPGSARYDRLTKTEWYRMYGVREYWLVDPGSNAITVVNLQPADEPATRRFERNQRVESVVLPLFAAAAEEFFTFRSPS